MANIESRIEKLLKKTIEDIGYELYDVMYVKEGKNNFLRIYIDKATGIDLNDCETVSNAISDLLDEKDYIKDQYFLEVSSSGIERVLRKDEQMQKYIDTEVEVNLYKPINKQKQIYGILKKFDTSNVEIQVKEENILIERKNISQIKTVYNWE